MMAVVTKKLLAVALVIACLVILVWAGLRANAAWHFIAAQYIAEPLFKTGGEAVEFERAESHIATALRRFPRNPDFHDFSGRLLILRAAQPGVLGVERRELLESAAAHFRQSLAIRPLWPYSWVNLLATKDKLGQVDMEFNMAMRKAAETGPWESGVQLEVLKVGIRRWSWLSAREQTLVRAKTKDALKVRPREVFSLVRTFGRADLVCDDSHNYSQITRWCAQVSPEVAN